MENALGERLVIRFCDHNRNSFLFVDHSGLRHFALPCAVGQALFARCPAESPYVPTPQIGGRWSLASRK
jgi:hypothetical protein